MLPRGRSLNGWPEAPLDSDAPDQQQRPLGAKLLLLGSLYVSQGLPFGLFTQALPVLMRKAGLPLEAIGLTSLLALPWALKFLWAPPVDRYGTRGQWVLPLQLASAATCLAVANLDLKFHLELIMVALFVTNLLSATQDIATDALAIDVLTPRQRGIGNGVQVAGYRLGMILGGGILLILFEKWGWTPTLRALAVLVAACTLPVILWREGPRRHKSKDPIQWSAVRDFVRRPGILGWLAIVFVYKLGEKMASGMVKPLLVDAGLSLSDIAWLLGIGAFTAGLTGALLGGIVADRLGRSRALKLFAVCQALAVLGYVLPARGVTSMPVLYGVCLFEHLASGMGTATLFACMMDHCRPDRAATEYTFQASLQVVSVLVGTSLGGFSAARLGYTTHFLVAASVAVLGLCALMAIRPRPALSTAHG